MEKESGYSLSGDHFLGETENYPLCKAMVDHDQQRVNAGGGGEVGDKVTRDLLKGVRGMRLDWGQWGDSGVRVQFVLLACSTALNVFSYELSKTQR